MGTEKEKSALFGILQGGSNFPGFFQVKIIGGGGGGYRQNVYFILFTWCTYHTGGLKP